jgi:hypothetical protein
MADDDLEALDALQEAAHVRADGYPDRAAPNPLRGLSIDPALP